MSLQDNFDQATSQQLAAVAPEAVAGQCDPGTTSATYTGEQYVTLSSAEEAVLAAANIASQASPNIAPVVVDANGEAPAGTQGDSCSKSFGV